MQDASNVSLCVVSQLAHAGFSEFAKSGVYFSGESLS